MHHGYALYMPFIIPFSISEINAYYDIPHLRHTINAMNFLATNTLKP